MHRILVGDYVCILCVVKKGRLGDGTLGGKFRKFAMAGWVDLPSRV